METEWAGLALVQNMAALSDQVEPVGPARICGFDSIVETVHQSGKLDAKFAHTCACDIGTFHFVFGAAEENVIADIRLHLPYIGWMRLKNVHGVEADLIVVLFSQLVQGGNLPPKGWSCVAAEDQNDRPVGPERRQVSRSVIFELLNG